MFISLMSKVYLNFGNHDHYNVYHQVIMLCVLKYKSCNIITNYK